MFKKTAKIEAYIEDEKIDIMVVLEEMRKIVETEVAEKVEENTKGDQVSLLMKSRNIFDLY